MLKSTYCGAIILLLFIEAFGQVPDLNFKRYTKRDGLSGNTVTAFAQTPDGFLWLGTSDGLNRFDGLDFKVFRHQPHDTTSLSDNVITALHVDYQGQLWIGTEHQGLLRYIPENESFERYNSAFGQNNTISHSYITSIKEDVNHQLWIGTIMGLNLYQPAENNFKRYLYETNLMLDQNSLQKLKVEGMTAAVLAKLQPLQDSIFINEVLFQSALEKQLDKKTLVTYQHAIYQHCHYQNNAAHIRVIEPDGQGNLWLAYDDGGLSHFNTYTYQLTHYDGLLHQALLKNNRIGALMYGQEQLLIGLNHGGLYQLNWRTNALTQLPLPKKTEGITALFEDRKSNIWVGHHAGIYLKRNGQERFDPYEIKSLYEWNAPTSAVNTVFQDHQGNIWIGVVQGGANQPLQHMPFDTFNSIKSSTLPLTKNCVSAVLEDQKGRLWVGYYTTGLDMWDPATQQLKHFAMNESDTTALGKGTVFSIFEDYQGTIWVGTYEGGLQAYVPESDRFVSYKHNPQDAQSISGNDVRGIVGDRQGNLWLAIHGGGVNKFNIASGKAARFHADYLNWENALGDDWVYTLLLGQAGKLWVGSVAGLSIMDLSTQTFQTFNTKNSALSHDKVRALHQDAQGIVWVGTEGGLNRFVPSTSTFTQPALPQYLTQQTITGITSEKNGQLWIATKYNLAKYHPQKNSVYTFSESDHFSPNEFFAGAYASGQDCKLYFGGFQGLLALQTSVLNMEGPEIPLALTGIWSNQQKNLLARSKKASQATTQLHHNENYITFKYTGINFTNAKHIRYAYQLAGFDKDWIYANSNREATYANLPHGQYAFMLKASVGYGQWGPPKILYRFNIKAPWWYSYTAFIIYGVVLVMAIACYRWLLLSKERARSHQKLAQIDRSYQKEFEAIKAKYYADMAQNLKAPFSLIKGPLQKLIGENSDISQKTRLAYFKLIDQNARKAVQLIEQLSDVSTIDAAIAPLQVASYDIGRYCQQIVAAYELKATRCQVSLNYKQKGDTENTHFDVDKLEKILSALLSHTLQCIPTQGKISVALFVCNGQAVPQRFSGFNTAEERQYATIVIEHSGLPKLPFFDTSPTKSLPEQDVLHSYYPIALVKQLVNIHSGAFAVSFEAGNTQYHVCIPVSIDAFLPSQLIALPDIAAKIKNMASAINENPAGGHAAEITNSSLNNWPESFQEKPGFIIQLYEIVDSQLADVQFGPEKLAECMNLSRSQLYKKVKTFTNLSVSIFIRNRRLSKSLSLLRSSAYSISEIAYAVGFNDPGYFAKCFKEMYGKSPTEFVQTN